MCISQKPRSITLDLCFDQRGSPTSNECDFHCCSLHAGQHAVAGGSGSDRPSQQTVATSPIQATAGGEYPGGEGASSIAAAAAVVSTDGKRSLPKGAHVRFSHVESVDHTKMGGATNAQAANAGEYILSYVPKYT